MAALKPSEKRLLIALAGIFFLLGNLWAWTFLSDRENKLAIKERTLRTEIGKFRSLEAQMPLASKRRNVLAKLLKAYPDITTRDTYLADFVTREADGFGLKLSKQVPTRLEGLAEDEDQSFIKSGYAAEVAGDRKSVLEFIHRLHDPSKFHFVKNLNLSVRKGEAQDGQSELVCNFEVQKWWSPESKKLKMEDPEAVAGGSSEQKPADGVRPSGALPGDAPAPPQAVPAAPAPTVGANTTNPSGTPPNPPSPANSP